MALEHHFRPGQRVFVAGSSNEPTGLLQALANRPLPGDLTVIHFPIGALNRQDFTTWHTPCEVTPFFMSPTLAKAAPALVHFLPMQMRAVFDYLSSNTDVYLMQVARDRDGLLRLGPNADFHAAAMSSATTIIAQLNTNLVAPAGAPLIDAGQLDFVFESDMAAPTLTEPTPDAAAEQIGKLVADLIQDGDCLQTGIGAIPTAVLNQLGEKNGLGMHGGIVDDAGMRLIARGNITGSNKARDTGKHITGMVLGSDALHAWLAEEPDVILCGANHTHEASVIRELDGFVSINSAVQVDLHGQVNAEVVDGRQISGTGGSVDFMRAARMASGGRSIVALTATARGGSVSRIVPQVEMVTALRTDIDIVVTEYGVAHLRDLPLKQRAQALIEIAAPPFREALSGQS